MRREGAGKTRKAESEKCGGGGGLFFNKPCTYCMTQTCTVDGIFAKATK
jgi:hypothetical protein